MTRFTRPFRFLAILAVLVGMSARVAAQSGATDAATVTSTGSAWTLQNAVLRCVITFANGSVQMTSLYNQAAGREYLGGGGGHLFRYTYEGAELTANDGQWTLGPSTVTDIEVFGRHWGKQLIVPVSRKQPQDVTVKLVFELYDGAAGLRYSTFIRNNDPAREKRISASDVIALNFPNAPHTLYHVPKGIWWTSTGGTLAAGRKNCLVRYESGDGWVLLPENNHATSIEGGGFKGDPKNPFLFIDAWHEAQTVRVYTNPKAVQLILFPGEEFEYFSVDLQVFKGDLWDGRKAAAQHLRQRFKYWNPTRVLGVNDWFYSNGGRSRPEAYQRSTVVPALKQMGFDLLEIDALWSVNRDMVMPNVDTFSPDLRSYAEWVNSQGVNIGYWVSLTGARWAKGRDLADPATIALRKKQMEEVMIPQYRLKWQQIDSGELSQTDVDLAYSHPSDSVYRKFVAYREYCNYITHKYPDILIRETCEFENIFKGGSASLMALADNVVAGNFWGSNGGMGGAPLLAADLFCYFGLYPGEGSLGYVGPLQFDASVGQMYQWLTARDIGIYTDPGLFGADDIARVRKFTDWMRNPRVRSLLNEIACPTASGGTFDKLADPYLWMFVTAAKDRALLIGTTSEAASSITGKLRWLDGKKTYLIEDVSLYNDGRFRYAFAGKKTGAELIATGLTVDFAASRTLAKAYWIQELAGARPQVLYADDKVVSYSENWTGTELTVHARGAANATGTLVVYKDSTAGAEVKSVRFDANGVATTSFDATTITAPAAPPSGPVTSPSNLALWTNKWSGNFAPLNNAVPTTNLAAGKRVTASSTLDGSNAANVNDGRRDTTWRGAAGQIRDQWVEIDFGAPTSFDTVQTQEHAGPDTITAYRIQVWNDGWRDAFRGSALGGLDRFPPVSAAKVRLYVDAARGAPAIDEIAVYKTRITEAEQKRLSP